MSDEQVATPTEAQAPGREVMLAFREDGSVDVHPTLELAEVESENATLLKENRKLRIANNALKTVLQEYQGEIQRLRNLLGDEAGQPVGDLAYEPAVPVQGAFPEPEASVIPPPTAPLPGD